MDRLRALNLLVQVIDAGNFSKCAEKMNVSQSTVSKAITALEAELGVKILNRTTRHLSMTEDGRQIYGHAKKVLDAYEDLTLTADLKAEPRGIIRVTCPNAFASVYLIPTLGRFMARYPHIQVRLQITDIFLDLYSHDIDLAFRIGEISDSRIIARKVGEIKMAMVASEDYLSRHTVPKEMKDLTDHNCILIGSSATSNEWQLTDEKGIRSRVRVQGNVCVDSYISLKHAVESGLGIGLAGAFLFAAEKDAGKPVTQVLENFQADPQPVNLLYKHRNLPQRVRLFLDFIYADLRTQNWIDR